MSEEVSTLVIACKATGTEEVERFSNVVAKADKNSEKLLSTVAKFVSAGALVKFGKDSVSVFEEQELALRKLETALSRSSGVASLTTKELSDFSKSMKEYSTSTSSTIQSSMAFGLEMGIGKDRIKEATKAAAGLAAVYTNGNIATAMRLVGLAANGNTMALKKYGIVIDENLSAEEKFQKLLEIGNGHLGAAKANVETLSGSLQTMRNQIAVAGGKIGEQLAPSVKVFSGVVGGLAESFANASPEFQRFVTVGGTAFTVLLGLKAASSGLAIAQRAVGKTASDSAAEKVVASGTSANATRREIALEKALQKEKLTTIALEQARTNVTSAREKLASAQQVQKAAFSSPNPSFDSMTQADSAVASAQVELDGYEKVLKQAELNALKASTATAALREESNEFAEVLKNEVSLHDAVASAELKSETAAKALMRSDEALAAAKLRLREAEDGLKTARAEYKSGAATEEDLSFVQSGYDKSKLDYSAELERNKQASIDLAKANGEVILANEALAESVAATGIEFKEAYAPEVTAAVAARNKALAEGKTATEAELAATKAFNKAVKEQTPAIVAAEAAQKAKNLALKRGATEEQANAVAMAVNTKVLKQAQMANTLWGRSFNVVATGARTAAIAVKSLMIELAPMLAISAVVAGVDYMINRSRVAAEGVAAIAREAAEKATKDREEEEQKQQIDNRQFERLKVLASYTQMTSAEQDEARKIVEALSERYKNLGISIDIVSGKLNIAKDAQKKLNAEQLNSLIIESKKEEKRLSERVDAQYKSLLESQKSFFRNELFVLTGGSVDASKTFSNDVEIARLGSNSPETYKSNIESVRNIAKALGRNVSDFDDLIDALQKQIEQSNNTKELMKIIPGEKLPGKENFGYDVVATASREALTALERSSRNLVARGWKIRFDTSEPQKQIEMLAEKIKGKEKELTNARERSERETDSNKRMGELSKVRDIELDILNLEYEKSNIADNVEKKKMKAMEEERKANAVDMRNMFQIENHYQETAQALVDARSAEAARMISRATLSESGNIAKAQFEMSRQTDDKIQRIEKTVSDLARLLERFKDSFDSARKSITTIGNG